MLVVIKLEYMYPGPWQDCSSLTGDNAATSSCFLQLILAGLNLPWDMFIACASSLVLSAANRDAVIAKQEKTLPEANACLPLAPWAATAAPFLHLSRKGWPQQRQSHWPFLNIKIVCRIKFCWVKNLKLTSRE